MIIGDYKTIQFLKLVQSKSTKKSFDNQITCSTTMGPYSMECFVLVCSILVRRTPVKETREDPFDPVIHCLVLSVGATRVQVPTIQVSIPMLPFMQIGSVKQLMTIIKFKTSVNNIDL